MANVVHAVHLHDTPIKKKKPGCSSQELRSLTANLFDVNALWMQKKKKSFALFLQWRSCGCWSLSHVALRQSGGHTLDKTGSSRDVAWLLKMNHVLSRLRPEYNQETGLLDLMSMRNPGAVSPTVTHEMRQRLGSEFDTAEQSSTWLAGEDAGDINALNTAPNKNSQR